MNQGLKYYEKVNGVFSICGYNNKIKIPKDYKADAYIYNRSSSWGWATWKDRWDTIDWKLEPFDIYKSKARAFCCWAGSDAWKMLNDWHKGKIILGRYVLSLLSSYRIRSVLTLVIVLLIIEVLMGKVLTVNHGAVLNLN